MEPAEDPRQPMDRTLAHGALSGPQMNPNPHGDPTMVGFSSGAGDLMGSHDLSAELMGSPDHTQFAPPSQPAPVPDRTLVGQPGPQAPSQPRGKEDRAVSSTRFQMLGVLGEGGMGKVFRARDLQIEGRSVALKVLHPQYSRDPRFRELFFQEIRAAQGFVSPHAVQIRDTGQMQDGSLFLTMDLVAGESLARKLRREGVLTPRHAFEIARQILLGLHSGHEQGLVHRDVKPSNVMLVARVPKTPENPFGVGVRLLDFGIAGLSQELEAGPPVGTPKYMSPEQVQGQRLDARSDLFAVGVVLFEMLSGTRPFDGETVEEVETSILETRVQPLVHDLKGLPRGIRKILVKALRKDRKKRYQSAEGFIKAIERSGVLEAEERLGVAPKIGMGLMAALIGAEGVYIYQQRQELEQRQGKDDGSRAALTLQLSEQGAELDRLQDQNSDLQGRLSVLQERLTDEGDLDTRFVDLQRDYDKLTEEKATLQRRNEELERRATELGSVRFEVQPNAKTAACFDEVLKRIDHGAGQSALELLKDRASKDDVFTVDGVDGRATVYLLAECAALLERAEAEGGDQGAVDSAAGLLARIRAEQESFLLEANGWLGMTAQGQEPVDRPAALLRTLEGLDVRLGEARERNASSEEALRLLISEGPPDQDPQTAFAYAERHGMEPVQELAQRLADHLDATAVQEGWLDPTTLASFEHFGAWRDWLAGPGSALRTSSADHLRTLVCAYSWYVERAGEPVFAELVAEVPELASAEPHHAWRAQLALQIALSKSEAYPLGPESTAVMRHTWSESGATLWFLERLEARTSEGWRIERRIHDAAGNTTGRPQSYGVTRMEDAFFVEGIKGLDLRSADRSVQVALFHGSEADPLPGRAWVNDLDVAGYEQALGAEPVPCLFLESGATELWFSPKFGLVREVRSGVYEREQVFYNAFQ